MNKKLLETCTQYPSDQSLVEIVDNIGSEITVASQLGMKFVGGLTIIFLTSEQCLLQAISF